MTGVPGIIGDIVNAFRDTTLRVPRVHRDNSRVAAGVADGHRKIGRAGVERRGAAAGQEGDAQGHGG
jgi:hypothetical protein